jgi:hypothetical protein
MPPEISRDNSTLDHEQGSHFYNELSSGPAYIFGPEPSAEFREDAAFLQSTTFDLDPANDNEELPPSLPAGPIKCDW